MEYHSPSFQHYARHQEQMAHYTEAQHMHNYAMAQQNASMMMTPQVSKTNETKPRLGKDEVDILEREFKKNPKPTTQTKRGFAEDMGVDLARINNWFQNRRAKRKQEKKQEAYEAGQAQEALGYSDNASSPDFFNGNGYYGDMQQSAPFPLMSGPPPPVASYNPQYSDPSSASMESLHRTLAAANLPQQEFRGHNYGEQNGPMSAFGEPLLQDSSSGDQAQFPAPARSVSQFGSPNYHFPSTFSDGIYHSPSSDGIQSSSNEATNQTPTPYNSFSTDSNGSQSLSGFPSQLLSTSDGLPSLTDSSDSQSPEDTTESMLQLGFKYDVMEENDGASVSPPAPSIPFKSPPPMDIASRRKKVHVKPAALFSETLLRNRPSLGPRTVSHADNFRGGRVESPISSPMRRIVSAGGNRNNVISGRVYKSGIESAQRSPINLGGFTDAGAFMEQASFHSMRNPPSLTALSSLNNSLAPPTPMSPPEREMTLVKQDSARSTASPNEGSMNFVFNHPVAGCFTAMEGDQNLASPPETPQAQMVVQSGHGWPGTLDFEKKTWFDAADEPLFTPGTQDSFALELHMPQPMYLSNLSQPVTPAFGQFNSALLFGHESPQYKHESPQYTLSTQIAEYSFPDSHGQYPLAMLNSALNKQKTFQFSNTTAADFSEK